MAGAGYKLFNTGDVLTAAQVNTYLQEQVVMVFADATARTAALSGVLAEGMVSYLKDTNATEVYDGSAWVGIGNSGDITGVTAGTGISGGGTSGTVTITNSMATEITAAGDIIVGTGSGTFDNLPIGTTGQILTADTTVSPYKVKWANASSGATLVGCSLYTSGGFSISNNTYTIVDWDSEVFDTDGFHSTSSNASRVTIPTGKSGKYQVTVRMPWGYSNAGYRRMAIKEDGTNIRLHPTSAWTVDTTSANTITLSTVIDATAGKYYQVELYQTSGGTLGTFGGISWGEYTWVYLGA